MESKLSDFEKQKKKQIFDLNLKKEIKAIHNIKTNPAHFYKYAKKFAKSKSRIGPLKHKGGSNTSDPISMANILQDQFTSVFSNTSSSEKEEPVFQIASTSFGDIIFDASTILKAIDELSMAAAAGEDGFPSCLLKLCKASLCYPIYLIWKESFSTGIIPPIYKSQLIIPAFKKGSKMLAKNYRPIALTSNIVKIFERVIRSQLVDYIESNNLISSNQHGFRKGHSCLSELLAHYQEVVENLAYEDSDVDLIYLDFAKAFDKVDHDLLLKKLGRYGINGKLLDWLT